MPRMTQFGVAIISTIANTIMIAMNDFVEISFQLWIVSRVVRIFWIEINQGKVWIIFTTSSIIFNRLGSMIYLYRNTNPLKMMEEVVEIIQIFYWFLRIQKILTTFGTIQTGKEVSMKSFMMIMIFVRYDIYDCNAQLRQPMHILVLQRVSFIGGTFVLFLIGKSFKISLHCLRKQYQGDGKVHYIFELEGN